MTRMIADDRATPDASSPRPQPCPCKDVQASIRDTLPLTDRPVADSLAEHFLLAGLFALSPDVIPVTPERSAADWAAKLHVALAPVYYQNYLLGELVASQLEATLRTRFGSVIGSPAVGEFLVGQVFAPGWSCRWDELIERATGAHLGVGPYAAELRTLADAAGA